MSDWYPTEKDRRFHEQTEELYEIENGSPDLDGMIELPVLFLRDMLVYPHMVSPIFVSPGHNLQSIQAAAAENQTMIALVQKEPEQEEPSPEDFLPVGIEVAVGRLLSLNEENTSALVQGRRRVKLVEFTQYQPYCVAKVQILSEIVEGQANEAEALMRTSRRLFEDCVKLDRSLPDEAHLFSLNISDPGWLADMIATAISVPFKKRQEILVTNDPIERLKIVNGLMAEELEVLRIEEEIQHRVQTEVDRNQREFYLREQMKAIQDELGEGDLWAKEIQELREKVNQKGFPEEAKARAEKEINRLTQMPPMSPEVGIIRTYIEWLLDLPWSEKTEDNLDVTHASEVLERDHYGLKLVKDRILEYIAVRSLEPKRLRQPILCFVGPPGTGKTSLGRSIAEALGRNFVRVSLGGVRDEAEIRGHRRTYIGSMPGRILQTLKRAGSSNPLFMLDEVDKLGNDYRGDPASALLEVLDPEQNYAFSDHYLEIPYDLSKVLFITTANTDITIPLPLLDRMEVIDFVGYIEEEKLEIAYRYLLPRQKLETGLDEVEFSIEEPVMRKIIREYTYEAGVRNLEREIGRICRKIARTLSVGEKIPEVVDEKMVEVFLGPPQFFINEAEREDEIGVATAIAWTSNGGDIMPIEVVLVDGKGNLNITGQIGDIMQESVQAALSYLKSKAKEFKIDTDIFENMDIHLHVPEGAIPKDGPSAGITVATAMFSILTGKKVRHDVGMTGEITLRGKALPIGGVREKVLAAYRAGLSTVILPIKNKKDLIDIPAKVMEDMQIEFVSTMDEVLKIAIRK
jgi:ATP-dependent Lon protease